MDHFLHTLSSPVIHFSYACARYNLKNRTDYALHGVFDVCAFNAVFESQIHTTYFVLRVYACAEEQCTMLLATCFEDVEIYQKHYHVRNDSQVSVERHLVNDALAYFAQFWE